jgi:hypothetical protein
LAAVYVSDWVGKPKYASSNLTLYVSAASLQMAIDYARFCERAFSR